MPGGVYPLEGVRAVHHRAMSWHLCEAGSRKEEDCPVMSVITRDDIQVALARRFPSRGIHLAV